MRDSGYNKRYYGMMGTVSNEEGRRYSINYCGVSIDMVVQVQAYWSLTMLMASYLQDIHCVSNGYVSVLSQKMLSSKNWPGLL